MRIWRVAAAASLTSVAVDGTLACVRSGGFIPWKELAPFLSATAIAIFAGYLVSWWSLLKPLAGKLRLSITAWAFAAAVGHVAIIPGIAMLRWNGRMSSPVELVWALAGGCLLGGIAYLVLARRSLDTTPRHSGRLWSLGVGACLMAVILSPLASPTETARDPRQTTRHAIPRVILITVDTLRADALSSYAPEAPPTPHLDTFTRNGFHFAQARAPSTWTLTSMSTILTGVSPLVLENLRINSALPTALTTLAERMSAAGYLTAAIGENPVLAPRAGLDRGFDLYKFFPSQVPNPPLGWLLLRVLKPESVIFDLPPGKLTPIATRWMERHRDEDFFLWLHYYDVHRPYQTAPHYLPTGMSPNAEEVFRTFDDFEAVRFGEAKPTDADKRWVRALYAAGVRTFDDDFGKALGAIKELGLYEDSLIILTSDHGEELWDHGGFEHGHSYYEEILQVPLVIKMPQQHQGHYVDQPATLASLTPTILELCGIPYEAGLMSATPLFDAEGTLQSATGEIPLVAAGNIYGDVGGAVLLGHWKYLRHPRTGNEELYNLSIDPLEQRSVAAVSPERRSELSRLLTAAREDAVRTRRHFGLKSHVAQAPDENLRRQLQAVGYLD